MRVKTRGSFFNYGSIAAYFLHALIFLLSIGAFLLVGVFSSPWGKDFGGGGAARSSLNPCKP